MTQPAVGNPAPAAPAAAASNGHAQRLVNAQLSYHPGDNGQQGTPASVTFGFNPTCIRLARTAKFSVHAPLLPAPANPARVEQLVGAGPTTISLGSVVIDVSNGKGADAAKTVTKDVEQLLKWVEPVKSKSPDNAAKRSAILHFIWGSVLDYRCVLENVSATYTRFTPSGQPIRATVEIALRMQPVATPGTNPTSGGLVGRRVHTVIENENLQHIAQSSYGDPDAWRAIAEVNGIDDPFTVPPGGIVYLPNPEELEAGGRR